MRPIDFNDGGNLGNLDKAMQDDDSAHFRYRGKDKDNQTSTTFLARLQNRDSKAWNDFMWLYVPLIRYWCRLKKDVLSRPERQDISADVLQRVSTSIGKFDLTREARSFRGWLRRITENRISDFLQERAKRKDIVCLSDVPEHLNIPNPVMEMQDVDDELALEQEAEERFILLKQILNRIKPEFREKSWDVFHLILVAEKDSSEIAEMTGMTGPAIRQIRSRILKRIREEYAELGIEADLPDAVSPQRR